MGGYFDPFLRMIDHAVEEGFVDPEDRALLHAHADPIVLVDGLAGLGGERPRASKAARRAASPRPDSRRVP